MDYQELQELNVRRLFTILRDADFGGYEAFLSNLNEMEVGEAATILMRGFLRYYRAQKADYIAVFMEKALRFNPEWAMTEDTNNPLLRTAFISGSKDLYDCYVEVVEGLDKDWFERAFATALHHNQKLLNSCQPVLIGREYNTGLEQNGCRRIDLDDYAVMDSAIVKYNQIVGLRLILNDLSEKSSKPHK
ncbi:MAG: hypothetical protein NC301_08635 [Bacteroides sp.]|nr:hypothetical protein [Alistipes timonensis]MCM1311070.1 hypothetical protein [Bacteroides sp.]MCM1405705.1 hypothetical protein [[Clostridium] fimetarium]